MNMEIHRVESRDEIRQFHSELGHLIQKAARTWAGMTLDEANVKHAIKLLGDAVPSARCLLLTLVSPEIQWEGFLFGMADLENDTFGLQSWYIKHHRLQQGFPMMFDIMDEYCRLSELSRLVFPVRGPLPTKNPRYHMLCQRYRLYTTLSANFEEVRDADRTEADREGDTIPGSVEGGLETAGVKGNGGDTATKRPEEQVCAQS